MAVNPIQFLVAQNASITDGTKIITISGNVDCSRVFSGTAVFLGGADNPAEAVAGTAPDGSGNSTITLRNNWSQGDVLNQQLVSFNTNEGLAEAISNVREIVSNVSAIEDLATQGLIKRISDNVYEVVNISAIGESLITANDASSQRSVLGLGSAATKNVGTASGNVMEVGAFGLGGTSILNEGSLGVSESVASLPKENLFTGWGTSSNAPSDGPVPSACSGVRLAGDSARYADLFIQTQGASSSNLTSLWFKSYDNANSTDWLELFHTGNSVNPLDYGLGVLQNSIAPNVDNFDTNKTSGLFRTVGNETGTPQNSSIASIINLKRGSNNAVNQVYIRGDESSNTGQMYFRGGVGSSFSDWFELYHTGNTNFNQIGNGTSNIALQAFGLTASTVVVFVPTHSKTPATSISNTTPFSLQTADGGTTVASGLNLALGNSTGFLTTLTIGGLSGITVDKLYRLVGGQATINF